MNDAPDETPEQRTDAPPKPSRRAVAKGAIWAAPTVIVTTAAPAFAVSPTPGQSCPDLPAITGARSTKGVTISQLVKTATDDDDAATATNAAELIKDIDAVAAINGKAIRTNFPWDFVQNTGAFMWEGEVVYQPDQPFKLDPLMVSEFKRVVAYARSKGIVLVEGMAITTFHDQRFPDADWLRVTQWWWEALAREFAPIIDILQVFNEASGYHYRFYRGIPESERVSYLQDMAAKMKMCGDIFRAVNPRVQITTNLYGWPINGDTEAIWMRDLAILAPAQDLISLDVYVDWNNRPDVNVQLYARMNRVREAFCKPVSIGEIGDSTIGSGGQATQAQRFGLILDEICKPDSPISSVFLYTLRDSQPIGSAGYDSEASFGLMTVDGQPKEAYRMIQNRGGFC